MKKTIRDFDLNNKKVIIRVDFNVPIKDGVIKDDNRIRMSLPTIKYAIDNGAKVILLSHLGRVKEKEDLIKNDLEPICVRLSELLGKKVVFSKETKGIKLEKKVDSLNCGDVLLIQNTRYEDLDGKKESSNDLNLGKYWANLGDIFINDAFATSHRAHASNVGIASNIPNGIGFLVEAELNSLNKVINNPERPYVVILGGAKVSDKIGVINSLVKKADYILIGGAMAFTFLKSQGIEIGSSILDVQNISYCENLLKKYKNKIILPIDVIVTDEIKENSVNRECFITDLKNNDIGVDIGSQTVELFNQYLENAKTIMWNGPVGIFEIDDFSNGTKKLLDILSKCSGNVIIGGGDTSSAAINFGYKNSFTHISTGGGATLELLEDKKLIGVEVIDEA